LRRRLGSSGRVLRGSLIDRAHEVVLRGLHEPDHVQKPSFAEHCDADTCFRAGRGVVRSVVDQGGFAEMMAFAQVRDHDFDFLFTADDFYFTLLDKIGEISFISLLEDNVARLEERKGKHAAAAVIAIEADCGERDRGEKNQDRCDGGKKKDSAPVGAEQESQTQEIDN
jgi:hypothetical protein